MSISKKKEIDRIDTFALGVTFPKYDSSFAGYREALKEIIEANFGYRSAKSVEYDYDRQEFYWQEESRNILKLGETVITFHTNIVIDPKRPLMSQIVAAKKRAETMVEHGRLVHELLFKAKKRGEVTDEVR